ncbi:hypothetical protein [Deinococcus ficus]|uniref:Uncharacterized protein n=1 Tax=Deinococcus ficus TaxID=317577 RepID=A0A221T3C7_9DEIO|nr:hypothetical protein [Deinococcus ficus]ASN83399.1 hypothetical protein DFI_19570 [Deinococcus ficus]
MWDDVKAFEAYEPGWFLSMSGSGLVCRIEEQDGDVQVRLTFPAVVPHDSPLVGVAVSPDGTFRWAAHAGDTAAGDHFEALTAIRALVLETEQAVVWDVAVRKRAGRMDDVLSGEEGISRRHVGGNRWWWRFVGDTVEVWLDAEDLHFKCVDIWRVQNPAL